MTESVRVLVADDEQVICDLFRDILEDYGHKVTTASDGEEALEILRRGEIDVLFTDMRMPRMGGMELLKESRRIVPNLAVIVITGFGTIEDAVEAVKMGAANFVTKPIAELEQIPLMLEKAMAFRRLQEENASLKLVNKLHDEFLALLSHELRTPLTNISGNLDALNTLYRDQISGDVKETLDCMREAAEDMKGIVESLLLAAELQVGRRSFNYTKMDMNKFLAMTLENFFMPPERSEIPWVLRPCSETLPVMLDIDLMNKAMVNLLDNAVKFNADYPGLEVVVESSRKGSEAIVVVRNTGKPVEARQEEAIFSKFKQADNYLTRRVGGLGLGLPITRTMLRKHSGDIRLDGKEGEGVAFSLNLPLAADSVTDGTKQEKAEAAAAI